MKRLFKYLGFRVLSKEEIKKGILLRTWFLQGQYSLVDRRAYERLE